MWAVSGSDEEEDAAPLTGPGAEGKGSQAVMGTLPVPRFSTTRSSQIHFSGDNFFFTHMIQFSDCSAWKSLTYALHTTRRGQRASVLFETGISVLSRFRRQTHLHIAQRMRKRVPFIGPVRLHPEGKSSSLSSYAVTVKIIILNCMLKNTSPWY